MQLTTQRVNVNVTRTRKGIDARLEQGAHERKRHHARARHARELHCGRPALLRWRTMRFCFTARTVARSPTLCCCQRVPSPCLAVRCSDSRLCWPGEIISIETESIDKGKSPLCKDKCRVHTKGSTRCKKEKISSVISISTMGHIITIDNKKLYVVSIISMVWTNKIPSMYRCYRRTFFCLL